LGKTILASGVALGAGIGREGHPSWVSFTISSFPSPQAEAENRPFLNAAVADCVSFATAYFYTPAVLNVISCP
jgi:hypothetical protein